MRPFAWIYVDEEDATLDSPALTPRTESFCTYFSIALETVEHVKAIDSQHHSLIWTTIEEHQANEVGARSEIYVQPFPGSISERKKVSTNGGTSPQWRRDGRELYFLSSDNHLMIVNFTFSAAGQTTAFGDRGLYFRPVFPTEPNTLLHRMANGFSSTRPLSPFLRS